MQLEWVRTLVSQSILSWFEISRVVESVTMLNKCFDIVAKKMGIQTNVLNFPSLSLESMKKLQSIGKSNTVYNLSKVISEQRPDGSGTLMPLQRMPFGMVHYIIDFFASTNVMQITGCGMKQCSQNFQADFNAFLLVQCGVAPPKRIYVSLLRQRLMCPAEALPHSGGRTKVTLYTDNRCPALDGLKTANPDGRYWLKLDGTDVKECLMESVKGVWNGDVDLGDNKSQELRSDYERRVPFFKMMQKARGRMELEEALRKWVDELEAGRDFLLTGLNDSVALYRRQYNNNSTCEQALKNAN
ncbi:uncharacterized protein [Montipora foliosa]|uniref:uncharacterized protein n=1 Tax=Montipora foliosa TaxID=591990 RepID=UPI0035F13CFC